MNSTSLRIASYLLVIGLAYNIGAAWPRGATSAGSEEPDAVPGIQILLPAPELSPREVVGTQVEALRGCLESEADLWQCYVFASPANRSVTGPIDRFARMLVAPTYQPLVEAETTIVGSQEVRGDVATVLVTVTDANKRVASYRFYLSRQTTGRIEGCWMTDGVIAADSPRRSPTNPSSPVSKSPAI